jgi:DNA mismatch repair protein PMS2
LLHLRYSQFESDSLYVFSKRINHLRTTGTSTLSSSITSLFGPKLLQTLLPIDLPLSVDIDKTMAKREGLDVDTKLKVRAVGMISKAEGGMGRTGGGGQYWYLNGRPFNPGKVSSACHSE